MAYYPVQKPDRFKGLRKYEGDDGYCRFFCVVCGCHVFRWRTDRGWEVATGVMKGRVDQDETEIQGAFEEHLRICDTNDGGLSRWLLDIGGKTPDCDYSMAPISQLPVQGAVNPLELSPSHRAAQEVIGEETLLASCDCGMVKFYITRPDAERSGPYPDLAVSNHDNNNNSTLRSHQINSKWGVVRNRYRAETCACRSCRLTTGFEIHPWAYIPPSNIHYTLEVDNISRILPLDLENIPQRMLNRFYSSPKAMCTFCNVCGATVFSRHGDRPDMLGVSVGLLRAREGSRARNWLSWWRSKVGFAEEVGMERWGDEEERARGLVESLTRNMRMDYEDNAGFAYGDDDPF